jgi:hypothetical protein
VCEGCREWMRVIFWIDRVEDDDDGRRDRDRGSSFASSSSSFSPIFPPPDFGAPSSANDGDGHKFPFGMKKLTPPDEHAQHQLLTILPLMTTNSGGGHQSPPQRFEYKWEHVVVLEVGAVRLLGGVAVLVAMAG